MDNKHRFIIDWQQLFTNRHRHGVKRVPEPPAKIIPFLFDMFNAFMTELKRLKLPVIFVNPVLIAPLITFCTHSWLSRYQ